MLNQKRKAAYTAILEEELIPAMGCTEPIAIAYAGALARKILGAMPDMVELTVSAKAFLVRWLPVFALVIRIKS